MQSCLEAESDQTGIKYPRTEAHKVKDGQNEQAHQLVLPSNEDIVNAFDRARKDAQKMAHSLGMAKLLQEKKCWEYISTNLYI